MFRVDLRCLKACQSGACWRRSQPALVVEQGYVNFTVLWSLFFINEGFWPVENLDRTLRWYGTVQYFHSVHTQIWTARRLIFVVLCELNTKTREFLTGWEFVRFRMNKDRKVFQVVCPLLYWASHGSLVDVCIAFKRALTYLFLGQHWATFGVKSLKV